MALTYEQLTELLLSSGESFEIHETRPDGSVHIFRGRDANTFLQRRDGRMHEHKAVDPQTGQLFYERDVNGRVYVGSSWDLADSARKQQLGRTAVNGFQMVADATRKALRYWKRQLR